MTPTIVTTPGHWYKRGKLRLVLGSPGGSTIITTVANDIISVIDNGLNIQQAADAPRFHHQYLPDRLEVEKKFPARRRRQLAAMGYTINRHAVADEHNPGIWGDSELIAVDPKTGELARRPRPPPRLRQSGRVLALRVSGPAGKSRRNPPAQWRTLDPQPVLRRPALMPLMVAEMARLSSGESGCACCGRGALAADAVRPG